MWEQMKLTMEFTTPLCGGVTRNDDLVEKWVELRAATDAKHRAMGNDGIGPDVRKPATLTEVAEERLATTDTVPEGTDEAMSKVWVGFSKDDTGLFVRGGSLRAHLKDCAQVLAPDVKRGKIDGIDAITNFKAKVTDRLYVAEDRIHLQQNGATVREATDHRDATMQVMTMQGPRTCLKRVDFVFPCSIKATIQILPTQGINRDVIEKLLEYGCVHGFNQDRSLQFGRYTYTLGK